MFASSFEWVRLMELLAVLGAGTWALYVYRTARRGHAKVAITHSARIGRDFAAGTCLLLVKLSLRNTSGVLWRNESSMVTLFDARKLASDGSVRLAPFGEADPFLPVYGTTSEDPEEIAAGAPFHYFEGQEISLEPGEQVESELAFPLDADKLGLMAMKVWLRGRQRHWSKEPYEWAAFFFIDPREPAIEGPGQPGTRM